MCKEKCLPLTLDINGNLTNWQIKVKSASCWQIIFRVIYDDTSSSTSKIGKHLATCVCVCACVLCIYLQENITGRNCILSNIILHYHVFSLCLITLMLHVMTQRKCGRQLLFFRLLY